MGKAQGAKRRRPSSPCLQEEGQREDLRYLPNWLVLLRRSPQAAFGPRQGLAPCFLALLLRMIGLQPLLSRKVSMKIRDSSGSLRQHDEGIFADEFIHHAFSAAGPT